MAPEPMPVELAGTERRSPPLDEVAAFPGPTATPVAMRIVARGLAEVLISSSGGRGTVESSLAVPGEPRRAVGPGEATWALTLAAAAAFQWLWGNHGQWWWHGVTLTLPRKL